MMREVHKKIENRLLIVSKEQFGYLTDVYKWCEYLKDSYEITVLTFDDGKEKHMMDGVLTVYVPNARLRLLRGILFMIYSTLFILLSKGKIIVCFFKECILFKKLMPWKHLILDVRTMEVLPDRHKRESSDRLLKECCLVYDFITVISEGLRNKLSLSLEKSAILPLGADVMSSTSKEFDYPRLLYVGTLFNRHIEITLEGLAKALSSSPFDVHYDIIGDGKNGELQLLKEKISELSLEPYVTLHGYISHDKIKPFFEKCNIGVSFVPITDYYDFQPPTKTFEYIMSGMFTIATSTSANQDIITDVSGTLINDDSDSFASVLLEIKDRLHSFNEDLIRDTLKSCTWQNIVEKELKPILLQN